MALVKGWGGGGLLNLLERDKLRNNKSYIHHVYPRKSQSREKLTNKIAYEYRSAKTQPSETLPHTSPSLLIIESFQEF